MQTEPIQTDPMHTEVAAGTEPMQPEVEAGTQPMHTASTQGPPRHTTKIVKVKNSEAPFKIQKVVTSEAANALPEKIVTEFYESPS